ncbi:MAG: hypothetical protein ACE5IE_03545 [Dehalococcoidia bacterium]
MIRTELCDMLGMKHPIIQADMGPYSTNNLAAANAGALGIISTSGLALGRIEGLPTVGELIEGIIRKAKDILLRLPEKIGG